MKNHETGQGLVEYTLILVLVAIAAILAMVSQYWSQLSEQLDEVFCQILEMENCQDDMDEDESSYLWNTVGDFSGSGQSPAFFGSKCEIL